MKYSSYILRREWYNILLLIFPFAMLPFIWDQMPGQIPIHWNLQGEVDRYGSKAFGLLILPSMNVFVYLILLFLPKIDPKERFTVDQKPLPVIRTITVFFLLGCHIWILLNATEKLKINPDWLLLAIAGLFVVFGNYMRTIKPNYFVGIRVPWALEDETNWRKTHRLGSVVWVSGGLLLVALFPFISTGIYSNIFGTVTILLAAIPIGYSFYLYKNQTNQTEEL